MKKIIDFLSDLSAHNDRTWFESHRARYQTALAAFNALSEGLIAGIGRFDPTTRGLSPKDCTYRIYRDVRFSPDKRPYKSYMGCYVCPGGKKSEQAGYYFHVEPRPDSGSAAYFLTAGLYMPEPKILRSVREEISDHPDAFLASIAAAKGFFVNEERKLTRPPKGFAPGSPVDEYLKLKDICLEQTMTEQTLLRSDIVDWAVGELEKTHAFNDLLNKAVDFAKENR